MRILVQKTHHTYFFSPYSITNNIYYKFERYLIYKIFIEKVVLLFRLKRIYLENIDVSRRLVDEELATGRVVGVHPGARKGVDNVSRAVSVSIGYINLKQIFNMIRCNEGMM